MIIDTVLKVGSCDEAVPFFFFFFNLNLKLSSQAGDKITCISQIPRSVLHGNVSFCISFMMISVDFLRVGETFLGSLYIHGKKNKNNIQSDIVDNPGRLNMSSHFSSPMSVCFSYAPVFLFI